MSIRVTLFQIIAVIYFPTGLMTIWSFLGHFLVDNRLSFTDLTDDKVLKVLYDSDNNAIMATLDLDNLSPGL